MASPQITSKPFVEKRLDVVICNSTAKNIGREIDGLIDFHRNLWNHNEHTHHFVMRLASGVTFRVNHTTFLSNSVIAKPAILQPRGVSHS